MSKIGNHRIEIQQSPAYRWGWEWAELGMELHHWLIPHLGVQWNDARTGWQDYRDQELAGGRNQTGDTP